MSLSLAASAVLGIFLRIDALTDSEIAQFRTRGCGVTYGACSGKSMYGSVSVTKNVESDEITLVANGIPDHATCDSSYSAGATCYNDPLTTWFEEQNHNQAMPLNPVVAASTTGLPSATVGYAINGVSIFSPYSRPCTDAIEDEAIGFDDCMGHPQEQGTYHYHAAPICLDGYAAAYANKTQFFIGVAWDGFPIYNAWDAEGQQITNSALDECHGYDPGDGTGYRYVSNDEFPYIIGCFKGSPLNNVQQACNSRRRLSAEEIQRKDEEVARVRRRNLLQGPSGGQTGGQSGGTSSDQDGCDEACSGNACDESSTVAMCTADDACTDCGAPDTSNMSGGARVSLAAVCVLLAVGLAR